MKLKALNSADWKYLAANQKSVSNQILRDLRDAGFDFTTCTDQYNRCKMSFLLRKSTYDIFGKHQGKRGHMKWTMHVSDDDSFLIIPISLKTLKATLFGYVDARIERIPDHQTERHLFPKS